MLLFSLGAWLTMMMHLSLVIFSPSNVNICFYRMHQWMHQCALVDAISTSNHAVCHKGTCQIQFTFSQSRNCETTESLWGKIVGIDVFVVVNDCLTNSDDDVFFSMTHWNCVCISTFESPNGICGLWIAPLVEPQHHAVPWECHLVTLHCTLPDFSLKMAVGHCDEKCFNPCAGINCLNNWIKR